MDPAPRTLGEVLARASARFGDRPLLLRRSASEEGAVRFRELEEASRRVAGSLHALGLRKGDRVGLLGENRWEWLAADFACARLGLPDVPRGGASPPAEVRFVLRHSGAKLAFVDRADRARDLLDAPGEVPDLRTVVLFERGPLPAFRGVEVLRFDDLAGRPPADLSREEASVGPDDLLTIVYTSGTTADPKGVMLTHGNVLSNLAVVPPLFDLGPDDVLLSLLPLWHMFERTVEYAMLHVGASILFTESRSLRTDLASGRPTILAAVPRVWETIVGAVEEAVGKLPPVRRACLRACFRASAALADESIPFPARLPALAGHAFGRAILYPRIRRAAAGRLRLAVSGGASLPAHVERFFGTLGLPLLNGYGMTETSPVVSVACPATRRPGTLGRPVPGTEVRIVDETGRDLPLGQVGLILVRGPQVTRGYWDNPDATRRAIDREGWLDTGDLGFLDADGYLAMRGRAKDTIVLLGGENVEPEPIEDALRASPFIDQAAVVGQDRKAVAALLVPKLERLGRTFPALSLEGSGPPIEDEPVRALFRAEIDRLVSRAAGFRPWERPTRFAILREPFSAAAGTMTATLKLRRRVVVERYAALIETLYAAPAPFAGVAG
ncbi:MAG TPA: long-chain fatty acid--CoA ligase [Planctomycetota bacterium]|nr:long-chain fatty acid--CoA ligase [Planctomycetota bacterium]